MAPDAKKYDIAEDIFNAIKTQINLLLRLAQKLPLASGCPFIQQIMIHWQNTLIGIPFLRKSLIEKEIEECRALCKKSKFAFLPGDRKVFAAYGSYNYGVSYDKMFSDALSEKIKEEELREQKLKKEENAKIKSRKNEYWAEHADEKTNLDSKLKILEEELANLYIQKDALPEVTKVHELQTEIKKKNALKDNLGVFKMKERQALQEEIDFLENKLNIAKKNKESATSSIMQSISEVQKRIEEICTELTKER